MMLDPNCGYFNEEKDDEYAPPHGECEECYRYDICRRAKTLEELLSGKMVKLDFPDKINTLMIQKSFDNYYVITDEVLSGGNMK